MRRPFGATIHLVCLTDTHLVIYGAFAQSIARDVTDC